MATDHHKTLMKKKKFNSKEKNVNYAPAFRTKFLQFISRVLCWMSGIYNPRYALSHRIFDSLLLHLDTVLYTRGSVGLIAHVKAIRTQLLNHLSGDPVRVEGVGTT